MPDRHTVAQEPRHRQPGRPGQPLSRRQTCLDHHRAGPEVRLLPGGVAGGLPGRLGLLHPTAQVGRALAQPGMQFNAAYYDNDVIYLSLGLDCIASQLIFTGLCIELK